LSPSFVSKKKDPIKKGKENEEKGMGLRRSDDGAKSRSIT